MKTLIEYLNGNKTIICTLIFGFIARFGVQVGIPADTVEMILWVAGVLGLGSFTHHVKKGYLSKKKGG